jgi:ATP-dependent DNA helicase
MAAKLLALEGEHMEVMQNTTAGKRGVISDAELDTLLDRRKEVFEGRGVGWKAACLSSRAVVVLWVIGCPLRRRLHLAM